MPGAWLWILVYVLVFGVFQLLLYRYLQGEEHPPIEQATPDYGDAEMSRSRTGTTPAETSESEAVRCPRCGAYNERDPAYTYCKKCVQRLR